VGAGRNVPSIDCGRSVSTCMHMHINRYASTRTLMRTRAGTWISKTHTHSFLSPTWLIRYFQSGLEEQFGFKEKLAN